MTASNAVDAEALSNVWVDVTVHSSMGMSAELVGPEAVDPTATVQAFLETNGCPVVWSPASNAWLTITQDFQQVSVAAFNTSQWARLTFCQNYSNQTASLFLNGHLLVTGVPFIDTNRTSYGQFETKGWGVGDDHL